MAGIGNAMTDEVYLKQAESKRGGFNKQNRGKGKSHNRVSNLRESDEDNAKFPRGMKYERNTSLHDQFHGFDRRNYLENRKPSTSSGFVVKETFNLSKEECGRGRMKRYYPRTNEKKFGNQYSKGQFQRRNQSLSRNHYEHVDNGACEVETFERSSEMKRSQSTQSLNSQNEKSNSPCSNRVDENHGRSSRFLGYKRLQDLSSKDPTEIISVLIKNNSGFQELLSKDMKPDWIVLTVKVLAKACTCEFASNKSALINISCQTKFLDGIENLILKMPTEKSEERKRSIPTFFSDLLVYFETMMNIIPSTATEKLKDVFVAIDIMMGALESHQKINLSEQRELFTKLNKQLQNMIEEREANKASTSSHKTKKQKLMAPPDDFREKSIYPTIEDLLGETTPFIRSNIVDGAYNDVEHYLDVQFRLLREDFVSPLREGIKKFLEEPDNKKIKNRIDNIRIYKDVLFANQKILNDTVGITVQFDPQKKMNINWEYSKRFMFGSLLLFTNDNFKNVLFGTVFQRDMKELVNREIVVVLQQQNYKQNIFDSPFLMIESEIYFEPYKHVLKALQTLDEDTFPMKEYIISVQNESSPPNYLVRNAQYEYHVETFRVDVLNDVFWPSEEALGLDKSQLEAFRAALSREFVIIQGPPGTGKTYLGLKIVKALLENREMWNRNSSPILVVCYTNHALDQFLEGLLSETDEIVRVGGQSKSNLLSAYNLREKRKSFDFKNPYTPLKREYYSDMKEIMKTIKVMQANLEELENHRGIVSVRYLNRYSIVSSQHCDYFNEEDGNGDSILSDWLLEGFEELYGGGGVEEHVQDVYKLDEIPEDLEEEEEIRLTMDIDPMFFDFGAAHHDIAYAIDLHGLEDQINFFLNLENSSLKHEYFDNSFILGELEEIQAECQYLQQTLCYWKDCLKMNHRSEAGQIRMINSVRNIWQLSIHERWLLYKYWLNSLKTEIRKKIQACERRYQDFAERYEEIKQFFDLEIMQNSLVVGMTTTNAARLQTLLQALKPRIVIVEEAAEVLESHIVISLTKQCEHVILIGDHKQLRPAPAVYKLARHFNFDISLFERMVKNGIQCHCLENQHRMRPEIAKLIAPTIYPDLKNHISVNDFTQVRGVTKSLYFISHNIHEEKDEEIKSHKNCHEADFILALCRHLILQGYQPEEITVLSTYKGQMFYMKQKQKKQPIISGVHVTVVDNYQGEENRIILLSLVRSNEEAKIGFLKIENRVCVALSRAKEGLFIIGNMENLIQTSEIWPKIKDSLIQQESFGTELILQCEVHPDQFTKVKCAQDFKKVPEGGCSLLCDSQLLCGHHCESICHAKNRDHKEYKCHKKCERIPLECDLQHKCKKLCYEDCGKCETSVQRTLPCGHVKDLPCHVDYNEYNCHEKVEVQLPNCDHKVEKFCFRDTATYPCPIPCPSRLPCGHSCTLKCHIVDDPDHLEYKCNKPCTKINAGCSRNHKCAKKCFEDCGLCTFEVDKNLPFCEHIRTMKCHEDPNFVECLKKCTKKMDCGHLCPRKCNENCGGCQVKVEKIIPECGHKIKIKCCEIPDPALCRRPCQRKLSCGHGCVGRCGQKCIEKCHALIRCTVIPLCGHNIEIPCYLQKDANPKSQQLLEFCKVPCEKMLSCEHMCKGTCGECMQGRIHVPCSENCGRILMCGHKCTVPCSNLCPPCTAKCGYKCKHSRCSRKCGAPCIMCKERCDWKCDHLKCTKLCYELCNRGPCYEPCKRKLKCRHSCIGFCGDKCPSLCRICDEEIVKEIFFGNEDDDDARFVLLVDCGHIIESEALEAWLKQSDGEILQKTCPRCKTPILQTERFMNYVKQTFKDIAKVKRKIFGDMKQLERERQQLLHSLLIEDNISLRLETKGEAYTEVLTTLNGQLQPVRNQYRNHLSQSDLQIMKSQIDIFQDLAATISYCITKVDLKKEIKDSLFQQYHYMLRKVNQFTRKFNVQVTEDFNRECKRFLLATQLAQVESNQNFSYFLTREEFKILYQKARTILESIELHTDEKHAALKDIIVNLTKKVGNIALSDRERKEIVQAIGLSQGHWFKCPNGHCYCIGECGGAMQVGICPECKEEIGGTDHHLLNSNALASEMDGALRHAWPGGLH